MMTGLHQAWIWLSRIGHCRGFGIQSPTDYRFVRYVVNEHWPYYAYAQLGKDEDRLRRKLGRLCFRLANHLQPKAVADLTELYAEYLAAGCKRADVTHALTDDTTFVIAPPADSMGALLASMGYSVECPEILNVEKPEVIADVHARYVAAGAQVSIGYSRAKTLRNGVQTALFNRAKSSSLQIGLICVNETGFLPVFIFFNFDGNQFGGKK